MDYKEEQLQELEVLESIYPDELVKESDTRFSITISLDTNTTRAHRALLEVQYPEDYPETAPTLTVTVDADEDDDDDDEDDDDDLNQVRDLAEEIVLDRDDVKQLEAQLAEEVEMNLGMPMVFALATKLKDDAELRFTQKVAAAQAQYDREIMEREKKEQQKFIGTPVTKELFAEWRAKFRKEMKIDERDQLRFQQMHQGKMLGKEVFEKGLAGDDDDLAEDMAKLET